MLLRHSAAGERFLVRKIDPPGKNRRLLLGGVSFCSMPPLLAMFPLIVVNLNVSLSYLHFAGALVPVRDNLTTNRLDLSLILIRKPKKKVTHTVDKGVRKGAECSH